jgi:hypothetical protein
MFDLDTEVIVESDNKAAVQLFSDLDFTTGERISLIKRASEEGDEAAAAV